MAEWNQYKLLYIYSKADHALGGNHAATVLHDNTKYIGEVAEWSNAPVSKTGKPERVSRVQIPPSPPVSEEGWQSGRMHHLGKVAYGKLYREFESPPLRVGWKACPNGAPCGELVEGVESIRAKEIFSYRFFSIVGKLPTIDFYGVIC